MVLLCVCRGRAGAPATDAALNSSRGRLCGTIDAHLMRLSVSQRRGVRPTSPEFRKAAGAGAAMETDGLPLPTLKEIQAGHPSFATCPLLPGTFGAGYSCGLWPTPDVGGVRAQGAILLTLDRLGEI